ncbi:hypothetical protein ACFWVC_05075 [Streptomyces sp. NPDC058691]|uniref:hypothetical protein n=1 Tax=Streptomyces sp. NPDC058691 TaxID=3346601 RepID=UPI003656706D
MPSVMGLLEERERAARQRVEILRVELRDAEATWQRFVTARETVGQVLAESSGREDAPVAASDERPVPVAGGAPGSVVPAWRAGFEPAVLAPGYRRLVDILAGRDGEAADCRQLAVALGLAPVPAMVEGVRSKAKRLVARGWLAEESPGMFSVRAGRAGGS